MSFKELAKKRYSCRSFSNKQVEMEKIKQILEVAQVSPTAVNFQPQRILVLQDPNNLKKIKECTKYGWNAPVMLIICYDKNVSWKRSDGQDEGVIDAAIATTHMMLEIEELGLGTTWIGSFNPIKLKELFNLPNNLEVVAILPVGYKALDAKPGPMHFKRHNLEEIVYWEKID